MLDLFHVVSRQMLMGIEILYTVWSLWVGGGGRRGEGGSEGRGREEENYNNHCTVTTRMILHLDGQWREPS